MLSSLFQSKKGSQKQEISNMQYLNYKRNLLINDKLIGGDIPVKRQLKSVVQDSMVFLINNLEGDWREHHDFEVQRVTD